MAVIPHLRQTSAAHSGEREHVEETAGMSETLEPSIRLQVEPSVLFLESWIRTTAAVKITLLANVCSSTDIQAKAQENNIKSTQATSFGVAYKTEHDIKPDIPNL